MEKVVPIFIQVRDDDRVRTSVFVVRGNNRLDILYHASTLAQILLTVNRKVQNSVVSDVIDDDYTMSAMDAISQIFFNWTRNFPDICDYDDLRSHEVRNALADLPYKTDGYGVMTFTYKNYHMTFDDMFFLQDKEVLNVCEYVEQQHTHEQAREVEEFFAHVITAFNSVKYPVSNRMTL